MRPASHCASAAATQAPRARRAVGRELRGALEHRAGGRVTAAARGALRLALEPARERLVRRIRSERAVPRAPVAVEQIGQREVRLAAPARGEPGVDGGAQERIDLDPAARDAQEPGLLELIGRVGIAGQHGEVAGPVQRGEHEDAGERLGVHRAHARADRQGIGQRLRAGELRPGQHRRQLREGERVARGERDDRLADMRRRVRGQELSRDRVGQRRQLELRQVAQRRRAPGTGGQEHRDARALERDARRTPAHRPTACRGGARRRRPTPPGPCSRSSSRSSSDAAIRSRGSSGCAASARPRVPPVGVPRRSSCSPA